MPNTKASQNYDEGTEQMSFAMVVTTVYTLVISLFLSNTIKKLIATLFTLQIIIHMFLLSIAFPGNIINVIKKIKPLVSFNILKPVTKYIEKFMLVDTLRQIEMKELIVPSVRGMGTT